MRVAWESVHLASIELASASPVKQRLIKAFSCYLADLDSAELPRALRDEFDSIRRDLTHVPPLRGETAIAATVRKMSNEQAGHLAQRIVRLLDGLSVVEPAWLPRQRTVVPMFSAEA